MIYCILFWCILISCYIIFLMYFDFLFRVGIKQDFLYMRSNSVCRKKLAFKTLWNLYIELSFIYLSPWELSLLLFEWSLLIFELLYVFVNLLYWTYQWWNGWEELATLQIGSKDIEKRIVFIFLSWFSSFFFPLNRILGSEINHPSKFIINASSSSNSKVTSGDLFTFNFVSPSKFMIST